MCKVAIKKLIAAGTITASSKAFCLNGETPSGSGCLLTTSAAGGQAGDGVHDSRAEDITVQHLLDHRGGWCRNINHAGGVGDFMFHTIQVANLLGVTSPPSQQDIVRFAMDQVLDFNPGSTNPGCEFSAQTGRYNVLIHGNGSYSDAELVGLYE